MGARIALVAAVLGLLAAAWAAGLFDLLTEPERMAALLRSWGAWGYLLYVVSFALLEPFFVPGLLFVVPASLIWPRPLAFGLSLLGSVGASVVGFGFARYLARDWVSQRLSPRLHRFDERLAQRGFQTVVLVRLMLFLAPPAHWMLGISRVRFWPFVAGSAIGFVPGIAALTWLGGGAVDWLAGQSATTWLIAGGLGLAAWAASRWRRSRSAAPSGPGPTDGEPGSR